MLEEEPLPKNPVFFICPCCKFSFVKFDAFITHCEAMKKSIDDAIKTVKK